MESGVITMLSLRQDQRLLSNFMCFLALLIGTSVFVTAAQAFQEEEPAAEVVDETSAEEATADEESEFENEETMAAEVMAEHIVSREIYKVEKMTPPSS